MHVCCDAILEREEGWEEGRGTPYQTQGKVAALFLFKTQSSSTSALVSHFVSSVLHWKVTVCAVQMCTEDLNWL